MTPKHGGPRALPPMARCIVLLLVLLRGLAAANEAPIPKVEVFTTKDFSISVPVGWRPMTLGPRFALYLNGDGIQLPVEDEGSPLQAGLSVEKFENIKETPLEGAKSLAKKAAGDPRFKPSKEPTVEELTLPGGTKAALVLAEGLKEGQRGSLQMKLLVKGEGQVGYIVSAWMVGAKDSKIARAESAEAKQLLELIKSIALVEKK